MKETALESAVKNAAQPVDGDAVSTIAGFDWNALLHNAYTWITLSFVIFVALFVRYLMPKINKSLDARAETIRDQLEQASRLRAEAEALLASYQRQQHALLKEAEAIIETAKKDAAFLRESAAEELKHALDRRTEQARDKIARAEAEAVNTIRTRIIETASEHARVMLTQQVNAASESAIIDHAIATIAQQVH